MKSSQKQRTSQEVPLPFFEVLGYENLNTTPEWVITSTFPLCCNLSALIGEFQSMPEEFMWLIFTQLRLALHSLHEICDPPIGHGDLHLANVVTGYSNPHDQDLPQMTVIDFGGADFHPFSNSVVKPFPRDRIEVLEAVGFVIHGSC